MTPGTVKKKVGDCECKCEKEKEKQKEGETAMIAQMMLIYFLSNKVLTYRP